MSLVVSLGSNQGNSLELLKTARTLLGERFNEICSSQIYESTPTDYEDQPNFFNQVIEFELPSVSPLECLAILQEIESKLGRLRTVPKGPRTLDLDIIFWDHHQSRDPQLILPHPRWNQRAFIAIPLMELPFYQEIQRRSPINPELLESQIRPLENKKTYPSELSRFIIN